MKTIKMLNLILISLLICSCNNNKHNKRTELISNSEKYQIGNNAPEEITFIPDSSIIGICLHSDSLVSSILGDNYKTSLNANADIPNLIVLNTKSNQLLIIYQHLGGIIGEFAEFEVIGFKDLGMRNSIKINDKEFQTESGIK